MTKQQPPEQVVERAVEAAGWSPCRSKRGVVVFRDETVIAGGYNYKPRGFECDGSAECKAACRVEAIHAEQQAIIHAGMDRTRGTDLLHVKAVDGRLVPSGGPSCVQCSKLVVAAGIAGVWLFHESGWHRYDAAEFHRLSIDAGQPLSPPEAANEPSTLLERAVSDRDAHPWRYYRLDHDAMKRIADDQAKQIAKLKAALSSLQPPHASPSATSGADAALPDAPTFTTNPIIQAAADRIRLWLVQNSRLPYAGSTIELDEVLVREIDHALRESQAAVLTGGEPESLHTGDDALLDAIGEALAGLGGVDRGDEDDVDEAIEAAIESLQEADRLRVTELQQSVVQEAAPDVEKLTRRKVITLCGSTRFIDLFATLTWILERQEKAIVLGCTLLPMWFCNVTSHFGEATGTKDECDDHHKRKIDISDEILVIDINGYIGESTRSEIEYATATGKPVRYLRAEPDLLLACTQPPALSASPVQEKEPK